MRNAFLKAVDEMKGNIDMGMLTQAVANNDRLLAYTSVFEKKWPSVLASTAQVPVKTYGMAGDLASKGLGRIGINTNFNLKSPEAINWARTNSSSLITNISSETRKGVQSVIGSAFDLGIPPKDAAKVIRNMVGLTEKQSIAASRYRDKISNQDRPTDQVERMAARYESKLLRYRGETIARTEIITSAHQGQKEAWQQAVDEGLLDPSETNREWITTDDDRLCPICEPMNGQIVELNEPFIDGDGEHVDEPPVHPNCRCTVGISFEPITALETPTEEEPVEEDVEEPETAPSDTFIDEDLDEIAASTADGAVSAVAPQTFTAQTDAGIDALRSVPPPTQWPIGDDVVRSVGSKYQDEVASKYSDWAQSLPSDQLGAIQAYTGSGYYRVNLALRSESLGVALDPSVRHEIQLIKDAITSAGKYTTPPPPELVWRGTSGNFLLKEGGNIDISALVPGDVISMSGFQSTSIDPHVAREFSIGSTIFEIKPSSGAWLGRNRWDGFWDGNIGEKEFLLDSGKQYKFIGIKEVPMKPTYGLTYNATVVQLEMLP